MSDDVSAITSFISEMPAVVALSLCSVFPAASAMIFATVVFPVPEGPKNIIFGIYPLAIIEAKMPFSPKSFGSPATSERLFGLILSAKG